MDRPTPNAVDAPGAWPATPSDLLQNSTPAPEAEQYDAKEAHTPTQQTITSYFGPDSTPRNVATNAGPFPHQQQSPTSDVRSPHQLTTPTMIEALPQPGADVARQTQKESSSIALIPAPTEHANTLSQAPTQPSTETTIQKDIQPASNDASQIPVMSAMAATSQIPAQQRDAGDVGMVSSGTSTSTSTAVPSRESPSDESPPTRQAVEKVTAKKTQEKPLEEQPRYEPLKTTSTARSEGRPSIRRSSGSHLTEDDIFRALSRRKTNASSVSGDEEVEEQQEIERLMSRMFGKGRQEHSEEEKTRHVGVIFKNLTVKGMGLGAVLQPTNGDFFLGPIRTLKNLLTKGPKAAIGKPPVRNLLSDFNGCVRPGEMLLVLGPPGSGCSTFLKVLGNQRFGYEAVEGEVTYGGTDAKKMAKDFRGEVLYNPEDDLHYATLSVKNTLSFAIKTKTPGKESRNEGESRKDYVREFLRIVTKLFWIEHTLGTKVGDEFVRGVSGGEKKRVSIAEAMITRASVQAWDNSTRGLDASTALEYVQAIRSLTNMALVSTAVALYQAGESLFDLFDKVLLIDQGRCLYFGPTESAKGYFQDLGFVCPDRWTTADFLTSVSDVHERSVKPGWEDRIPRSAAQFAEAYQKSGIYQKNLEDIRSFEIQTEAQRRERLANRSKATKKKNYTLPFHKQVWACTQRQVLVTLGDKASLYGKWGGILFQALIVGSLFYDMPSTTAGVFTRGGVMFFMLLFNALLALAELTSAFSSKPILLKHKSFSFYRPAAYAIAQTVVDIPLVLIQVSIFNIVVYFMSNLSRTPSQFFIAELFLWITTMTMYAFFRACGALNKSLDNATRITGVAIQALIVYTGYLIPPTKMKPWFKWLIWVNPVQYGFEGLMANEFYNLEIQCEPPYLVPQGPNATPEYQSCLLQGSQPGQTTVNGADYIRTAFTYSRTHLWRNVGLICAFFLFFVFLTMFGMEIAKPNAGGGAVTVFKRGQVPKKVEESIETGGRDTKDEESGEKTRPVEKATESDSSDADLGRETSMGQVAKNETVFTWQNVNYTIPYEGRERNLLQEVQGYVRPGKLTALMGASGAGKTTLLNTLAQRINFGVVTGDFLVDGRPLPKSFQRATGFAEQMDIHEPTATVREALRFSALLRQPKEVPFQEKYDYCERILELLEMKEIAGATIGKIGSGLNQEQRKRVTIGVELASKPELLMFLDEPTSGLDSGAAFNIVRFLRKLADAGQAILCTIHQPSSVLFEHFDELLLLKSGGRVVYHGPLGHDSRTLIDYFESNGAKKCARTANPAEYMLEAIGAGNPDYKGQDWGDVWVSSAEHEKRSEEIQEMISSRSHAEPSKSLKDDREYAMPLTTQTIAVLKRSFVAYWRTPEYIIGKFMLHIVTGLFNTFTFYHVGYSQIDMQSRLFSIFMTLTISPPLIQQLQPRFLDFRNIFEKRESNSKIYSWIAFVTGAVVVEIPYSIVAGSIYFCCWWFGAVGRNVSPFASGYTYLLLMLFELYYVSFGQAIASFAPNELLASLLVPVFFLFVVAFCGVVVPAMALPYFWRSWMYWVTPFHYLLEGFLAVAIHDQPVICSSDEFARFTTPTGQTCESYTGPFIQQAGGYVQTGLDGICEFCQYANGDEFGVGFSVFYSNIWRDFGIFAGFCVFNYFVIYFCSWLYLGGLKKFKPKGGKGKTQDIKTKVRPGKKQGQGSGKHSEEV
jgi:ATP-binding cassette, subfamily G (WHITE), member 2, SNQ2